jgi:hypothetical protein
MTVLPNMPVDSDAGLRTERQSMSEVDIRYRQRLAQDDTPGIQYPGFSLFALGFNPAAGIEPGRQTNQSDVDPA